MLMFMLAFRSSILREDVDRTTCRHGIRCQLWSCVNAFSQGDGVRVRFWNQVISRLARGSVDNNDDLLDVAPRQHKFFNPFVDALSEQADLFRLERERQHRPQLGG